MKKNVLIIMVVALFVFIPVSVYGANTYIQETTTSTVETSPFGWMMDNNRHQQYIDDQKLELERQLQEGIITQEQYDERLSFLIQMDEHHDFMQTNSTFRSGCH